MTSKFEDKMSFSILPVATELILKWVRKRKKKKKISGKQKSSILDNRSILILCKIDPFKSAFKLRRIWMLVALLYAVGY